MGRRAIKVTNPYEASDYVGAVPQGALWTTTEYDALGRAWKVTTPDGALKMADAPQMFVAAFVGFLLADVTLIFAAVSIMCSRLGCSEGCQLREKCRIGFSRGRPPARTPAVRDP